MSKKKIIPIKNVFYMLCYAWNVLPMTSNIKVDNIELSDAYNLLAMVFTKTAVRVVNTGLYQTYVDEEDELSVVRGKINIDKTIRLRAKSLGKVFCEYENFTDEKIYNGIIRYTIDSIIKNSLIDKLIRQQITKVKRYYEDIVPIAPTREVRKQLTFNQNNILYRTLIHTAIMLFDGTSVSEESGNIIFKDFLREEQMNKVFQDFLLNFYKMHLDKNVYRVHAPKIYWPIDEDYEAWDDDFDVSMDPGDRRTDIVIVNKKMNYQFIIDAKFYQSTLVKAFMSDEDKRVRASHFNQVRGYLLDSKFDGFKVGSLIYPKTDVDLCRGTAFMITGTPIIVKTIDLNLEWKEIEKDLLAYVDHIESSITKKISQDR